MNELLSHHFVRAFFLRSKFFAMGHLVTKNVSVSNK